MNAVQSNSQSNLLVLVVTLTVRNESVPKFREFEHLAARIMHKHGGAIERTVVIPAAKGGEFLKEIHIITFPDQQALENYREDDENKALAPMREAAIFKTEIWAGEKGPDYLAAQ